ncbi:MAG: hypothetical protein KJ622_08045 [Alphaproteobacteria bacterium]|nr:hypothetical protein [Alphaproteobacteria bacterium]
MNHWIGIAILVVPLLLITALFLKRPVWWFLVVLTGVGLGYLHTTGATVEIGNMVLTEANKIYPTGFEPEGMAAPAATEPAPAATDGGSSEGPVRTVPTQ